MLDTTIEIVKILFGVWLLGVATYATIHWRRASTRPDPGIMLEEFLQGPLRSMSVVATTYSRSELPNLHLAIERLRETDWKGSTLLGIRRNGPALSLQDLVGVDAPFSIEGRTEVGPITFRQCGVGTKEQMRGMQNALVLVEAQPRVAVLLAATSRYEASVTLEVIAATEEAAGKVLRLVQSMAAKLTVYRGKMVSIVPMPQCSGPVIRFHDVPRVEREAVILPERIVEVIDRNTIRFIERLGTLRKNGRPVKRGLLLHGKPGTGKSYTVRYIVHNSPGVTVFLLNGEDLCALGETCAMARMLEPSIVVIEDVDLIARQRTDNRYAPLLHELLNQMDGIDASAAVTFILTTNRPDLLEPALAARPGRVDQAIEFPLPDDACRRRMFAKYSAGLDLHVSDWSTLVARTAGASGAFIQELMRKASLIAVEDGAEGEAGIRVDDSHLDRALREMLVGGEALTRVLLGFEKASAPISQGLDGASEA